VTTIFYLLRKARGASFARSAVRDLMTVFRAAPVTERVLRRALELPSRDFEDAVCAAAGESARCEVVVTRDPKGFRGCGLLVLDPSTALAALAAAPRRRRRRQSVR
jgi:predicted nucleic acid-binding protein